MRHKILSPLAIALLGLATSQADENDKSRRAAQGAAAGAIVGDIIGNQDDEAADAAEPDNLHDAMETIGKSLKKLRRLEAEDWDGGAELVKKARRAAYLSIEMIPDNVLAIPDEKVKAREIANYQRLVSLSYSQLCELELAYRAQDADAVKTAKKAVFSTEKEGHDKYKSEDEH